MNEITDKTQRGGGAARSARWRCRDSARAQAKSVKIAMIAPLSGPWARQGQLMRMGAEMALEDINGNGGIKSSAAPSST